MGGGGATGRRETFGRRERFARPTVDGSLFDVGQMRVRPYEISFARLGRFEMSGLRSNDGYDIIHPVKQAREEIATEEIGKIIARHGMAVP